MLQIHQTRKLSLGNQWSSVVHRWSMVTWLCTHYFQMLPHSTTLPHSTWHQAHNQAPVKPKDIWVMGHCGKYMMSPKVVMVDLICSSDSNSQDLSHLLHPHLECKQYNVENIQSLCRHGIAQLHQSQCPVPLRNPRTLSQPNNSSQQQLLTEQMLLGLLICTY